MEFEGVGYILPIIEFPIQAWVNAWQVVALEKIVDVNLPVAFHHVIAPLDQLQVLQRVLRGLLRQFAQSGNQSLRSRIQIHEHPRSPFSDGYWLQSELVVIKIVRALHLWRVQQMAIE